MMNNTVEIASAAAACLAARSLVNHGLIHPENEAVAADLIVDDFMPTVRAERDVSDKLRCILRGQDTPARPIDAEVCREFGFDKPTDLSPWSKVAGSDVVIVRLTSRTWEPKGVSVNGAKIDSITTEPQLRKLIEALEGK